MSLFDSDITCYTVWESVEHHKALMDDPQIYPQMLGAASVCVVAPVKLYHVWLESDQAVTSALNAPVTSISHIFDLGARNTQEGLFSELSNKFAIWHSTAQSGFYGGCFGKVLENDELTVICGWDWGAVSQCCVNEPEQLTFICASLAQRAAWLLICKMCQFKRTAQVHTPRRRRQEKRSI
jgi:hypothetical protein